MHSSARYRLRASDAPGRSFLAAGTAATGTWCSASARARVLLGDQETLFDAERIRATGCKAIQINTGAGCHLDASMLDTALRALDPPRRSVVFIENVGNLVSPALFDLGEAWRVVLISVTEGADKPLKYPHMFRTADIVLLNKVDLLPYVDFDEIRFQQSLNQVNPETRVLHVSATRGDGIPIWYTWLRDASREKYHDREARVTEPVRG